RLIKQAKDSGIKFDYIFITPELADKKEYKSLIENTNNFYLLKDKLIDEISDTVNSQGIIAIAPNIDQKINSMKNYNKILLLDRVQDPGNMGTIIRSAAASGFESIISLKGSVDIYNLKVIRATAGAIFSIPFVNKMSIDDFLKLLKNDLDSYQLITTDLKADNYYHQVKYKEKNILVIGNEANGIRKELLEKSNLNLKIPLNNNIESINAAMAATLLMYKINYN
ncbi:MAG: TrmH family RNA methyltransferase, partial [Bacillota bacterium]